MFKEVVILSQKKYLGFGINMPWENNLEIQFDFWRNSIESGKIQALQKFCHAEQVYGVFCYSCNCDEKTFSYHIACENKQNKIGDQYEELTLYESAYAKFINTYKTINQRNIQYQALCDELWEKWLPNSDYISLIEVETNGCMEGYASIEIYKQNNPFILPNEFELWIPVQRIEKRIRKE